MTRYELLDKLKVTPSLLVGRSSLSLFNYSMMERFEEARIRNMYEKDKMRSDY
jgi:hypothetical protein